MSVGFIGAGQLAHALVRGFTAAGEFLITPRVGIIAIRDVDVCWLQSDTDIMSEHVVPFKA